MTQVTAVTIVIYVARKVNTAYIFCECFEACHVSELTTDLWLNWKVLGNAANASHRPLYQNGVVQNHSFLGVGEYWS